ncbi:MAG: NADH-quinone oxidoreductase subunit NuoF [Dehalococcoidales bacterium]|nr:NADH-quinone oxidoreductase subunit NuoF [Dehalococcoidales bacterium]
MEKILTKNIDKPKASDIEVYLAGGGYQALPKALSLKPEGVISEVKKSKLVGRGGAAFPVGLKWDFTRKESTQPRFIVCNADEGEPGTFKDRVILKNDPHLLIEAIIIAGYAIGADKGFIYIRGEYYDEIEAVNNAIQQAKQKGYLGSNILSSDFSFDIQVYRGVGAYICGEETSLIQSMEGNRPCPDDRPPFPTQSGFMDKPTALNNVETLANIPSIINRGGDWYSGIGSPDSPGTKLFCLSGQVNKPGLYELPLGITLGELIENYGSGVNGKLKAVLPGGVSSRLLTDPEVKLDYKDVARAGSMLGSASVIVINQDTSIVDVARNTVEFFTHESCGKCSICREGTRQAREILTRMANGNGSAGEIDLLLELGEVMYDTACCGLGQAAMNVPTSAITLFRNEFEQKVR